MPATSVFYLVSFIRVLPPAVTLPPRTPLVLTKGSATACDKWSLASCAPHAATLNLFYPVRKRRSFRSLLRPSRAAFRRRKPGS